MVTITSGGACKGWVGVMAPLKILNLFYFIGNIL